VSGKKRYGFACMYLGSNCLHMIVCSRGASFSRLIQRLELDQTAEL
jgi:hypothetical protein